MPTDDASQDGAGPPSWPADTQAPLIIDTDLGGDADDAIALAAAAHSLPELALVITTDEIRGERARFARHLLDELGRPEVPVVAGAELGNTRYFCVEGLTPTSIEQQPTDVHRAVNDLLAATTGPLRWVGMGPMTNLHRLLRGDAALAQRLQVTQMGGAINYRNPTQAEHNFRLDPDAARHAVAALTDLTLVTSDVTFTDQLAIDTTSAIYRSLTQPHAPDWATLIREHLDRWFARFHPATMQHDALTLSAAMRLPFVTLTHATVTLDPRARMRADPDGVPVWMSTRALYPQFMDWLARQLDRPRPHPHQAPVRPVQAP